MNALVLVALLSCPTEVTLVRALDGAPLPIAEEDPFGLALPYGLALDEVALQNQSREEVFVEVQARVGWSATLVRDGVVSRRQIDPANDAVTRWIPWSASRLPSADLSLLAVDERVARLLHAPAPSSAGATSTQLELRELRVRVRSASGETIFARAIYVAPVERSAARG